MATLEGNGRIFMLAIDCHIHRVLHSRLFRRCTAARRLGSAGRSAPIVASSNLQTNRNSIASELGLRGHIAEIGLQLKEPHHRSDSDENDNSLIYTSYTIGLTRWGGAGRRSLPAIPSSPRSG